MPGILSKICSIYTVTFVCKEVLSSEITQITDDLIKEKLQQDIFMGSRTF